MAQTLVRIRKDTLFKIFEGFENRKKNEPNFKYGIPNDDTVVEFNTSITDGARDPDGAKTYGIAPFACFDDEKNILMIQ